MLLPDKRHLLCHPSLGKPDFLFILIFTSWKWLCSREIVRTFSMRIIHIKLVHSEIELSYTSGSAGVLWCRMGASEFCNKQIKPSSWSIFWVFWVEWKDDLTVHASISHLSGELKNLWHKRFLVITLTHTEIPPKFCRGIWGPQEPGGGNLC